MRFPKLSFLSNNLSFLHNKLSFIPNSLSFLSSSSIYPVGLDISDFSIKLMQLNKIRDKITIQAIGKVNLPKGLFQDGEIKNKKEIIKTIKELIIHPKYGKVSSTEIVTCLPETKTFVKLIEVEKTPNDLSTIIETEIEKHVPMPLGEIYYDWQIIKEAAGRQSILIGAAPQYIVNQYTDLLDEAKLSVAALEIEPIALCRSLLPEEHLKYNGKYDKNYGILDIGAKRTSMSVYSKNTILFAFSMPISGEEITDKIAQSLKINYKQAEKAKIICGLSHDNAKGVIKDILSEMIKELTAKINEAIVFYNNHFPNRGPIDKILLCGGGANIKNLDKIINKATQIEVMAGDSFANLSKGHEEILKIPSETHVLNMNTEKKNKILKATQSTNLTFATAIGLALRGIFVNGH